MNEFPLVRVRYADSFAQALNQLGAPTNRLLNKIGITEDTLAIPNAFIPVEQLWNFTALASSYTGIPDFGLRSGLVPLAGHSPFGHSLLFAPTLFQAMTLFCQQARSELSNADFQVRRANGQIWFCGGAVEGTSEEVQQVELYRIGMMVQVIRWAAGDDWQISDLQLQSSNERSLQDTPLIRNANVAFGCSMAAIRVPEMLPGMPLHNPPEALHGYGASEVDMRIPERLIDTGISASIKEIIRTHVLTGKVGIEQVASALGMPVRSLQRRLACSGTSYQHLLDQCRIEMAQLMLQDSSIKLQQIAYELGYSEATHFTRAFRRTMGMTPRAYRQKNIPDS